MESSRPVVLACAAACVTAAPLFLAPGSSSKTPPSLRQPLRKGVNTVDTTQASASSSSSMSWCAGLASGGALFAISKNAARAARTHRISRKVATIDAAEAEVEEPEPQFNPADQVGAMVPLGFFDPLGFTKIGDEEGFNNLRASELKHGRVAMMASVGLVGQHFLKFPGFDKTPAGFAALGTGEGALGFIALAVSMSVLELAWRQEEDREPGNFGDPFGVNMYTEEMRNKEISNGRFAMICVVGIIVAELASGKDAIQQFGF